MADPTRYTKYATATQCSVPGCNRGADYEVYLYDYYPSHDEEFFEQDFTCPFLCRRHLEENEARAEGDRVPRGYVTYLYTNRHHAQGYSKYAPISAVFPQLVDTTERLGRGRLVSTFA